MKSIGSNKTEFLKKLLSTKERAGPSSMYISSNVELTLFRCKGIVEYTSETVILKAEESQIKISGEKLELKSFSTSEICVMGKIYSIEFIKKEREIK